MSASDNKALMQEVFAQLAQGNNAHLEETLADDCRWTVIGTTPWSGTRSGKQEINDFLQAVNGRFAGPFVGTADRFISEGDYVVVQFHGHATTDDGRSYDNTYCWVCRLSDGRLREITEYGDTQLAMTTLFAR